MISFLSYIAIFKNIIEFFQREWTTIKKAPATFIITFILALFIGATLIRWVDNYKIDDLTHKLQTKEEQLQRKDEQFKVKEELLTEYRERLKIVKPLGASYSTFTNKELLEKALEIAKGIWSLLYWYENEEISLLHSERTAIDGKNSDEERKAIRDQYKIVDEKLLLKMESEYNERFRTDAINLFDEILSRLPQKIQNEVEYSRRFLYDHPTNRLGIEWVACHLEILAKQLQVGVAYLRLSIEELQSRVKTLCEGIKELLDWYKNEDNKLSDSEKQKKEELFSELIFKYNLNFRTEAILLFDAMFLKLPEEKQKRIDSSNRNILENPINITSMKLCADLLERISKQLIGTN